jgi:MFS family permease
MRLGAVALIAGLLAYPMARTLWHLVLIIPLVPIGTALLFPATTSLMSRYSEKAEVGTTLGTAQTYAGISRVLAPLVATIVFQRLGHGAPFVVAAALMALVSVLAFKLDRLPAPAPVTAEFPAPPQPESR